MSNNEVPIPMVLFCPACTAQHIDAPQPEKDWDNPPHRSHECQFCGHIWRPADVPTTGVAAIETRGKLDSPEMLKSRSVAIAAFLRYMNTDPKDRSPICHGDGGEGERLHFLKIGHVLTGEDVHIHLIVHQALSRYSKSTDDPLTAARRAFLAIVKNAYCWDEYDCSEGLFCELLAREKLWRDLVHSLGIRLKLDEDTVKSAVSQAMSEIES